MTFGAKITLLLVAVALYLSGLLTWIFDHWFFINLGFGPEPRPARTWWLHAHSVIGIGFLILFGYLIHSHLRPGWKRRKRRLSGTVLTCFLGLLILTVPFLFYASDDWLKAFAGWLHTYIGIAGLMPFLVHWRFRQK